MNITKTINSKLHEMTKSELKIASYFLENANAFAFETLEEIAKTIDTSTTSVIRFCRRIGFPGYKAFQNMVKTNVKSNLTLPDKLERVIENNSEVLDHTRIVRNVSACIHQTFEKLSPEEIIEASNTISAAKRVFCFGLKESYALAHYAYTRFLTIRENVFILTAGHGGEIESLLSLGDGDVCVFFLFHRYTNPAPKILEILKKQGVTVILVTSPPYDCVEQNAAILLPCYVDINGIKNSSAAPICLIDCLCNCVATYNEKTLDYLKKSENLFEEFIF